MKIKDIDMDLIRKNISRGIPSMLSFKIGLIILAMGLVSVSCASDLEEEVYSSFTGDNFYTNVASAELGLFGIYDVLATDDLYGRGYLLYFHTGTDQERYWRQDRGLDDDLLANYQIQENNAWVGEVWSAFYKGIYRANQVIERVTVLRDANAGISNPSSKEVSDLAAYNNVLGDAYFLRGFMYFQLVKNWGDVPLRLTSNISLETLKAERSPKEEVFKQIEKDMTTAIGLLPEAPNVKSASRVSKGAAQGILTRIYLTWAGEPVRDVSKYGKAVEQAWAVVSGGQHQLNTTIDPLTVGAPYNQFFPQVFKNLSEKVNEPKESMWEIHFSYVGDSRNDASTLGTWHGVTQHTNSIYKRGAPRRYNLPTFYDTFETNDSIRRDYSIAQFEIDKDNQFIPVDRNKLKWGVGKFRRYLINSVSSDHNYDVINVPILRYADVLLMLAEGINETVENGGVLPAGVSLSTAYDAINQVRRRARMLPVDSAAPSVDITGSTGEVFRQQIRNERSWELCNENLRKPDLIRWGILVETVKKTGVDMAAAGYGDDKDYFPALHIQEHHVLLPIPFSTEISQNPDVLKTDPSNNGYR
ncbi:RagB/SusD family nutrient uptake outer membrane protein [Mariniflexile ostreae]|uniref:RagB/SusD family nutrient uptake outer membrane protein n=1 Tax=Mariniflexile ostreae TaxID=1520892 RepID=A0ABV5FBW1_9FLAO